MADGIRNKVEIVGMGCTRFGELWDKSAEDLIIDAVMEALEDAGLDKKAIQAAWLGTLYAELHLGNSAVPLSETLRLPFIPVTRVENYCGSGTEAFRGACYAVAGGAYDIALAVGVEKLKDTGYGGLPDTGRGPLNDMIIPKYTAPGAFAMLATRYFSKYNISPSEGKTALAHISAKSHHNGMLNPKAHLRNEVSIEKVLNAPMIAWPLGLFDCCGVSDGAAAAVVTTPEIARSLRKDSVRVKALQISASSGEEAVFTNWDGTHVETTYRAGIKAYEEAGIKKPREEISLMEVHDCFSITELVIYEDLQISERGEAIADIMDGFYNLDGKIPCQPDGGLKCFGHPIGASGLRMIYEIYKQLQGKAGPRQIKDPRIGLTHNLGGVPHRSVCSIGVFGL